MADTAKTKSAPVEQLFDELGRVRAGMLGVAWHDAHMVPMAPHAEADTRKIYFFTKRSSDLVAAIGMGGKAHFCLVGKDHDYHACLSGPIVQSNDRAAIERHWSAMISAWFPGGKEDPELTLLEFTPNAAEVWASTDSAALFAWEIAKALTTGSEPHVGATAKINF